MRNYLCHLNDVTILIHVEYESTDICWVHVESQSLEHGKPDWRIAAKRFEQVLFDAGAQRWPV